MSTRKFTEEDIDEMVFLAKKFNSYRKAAIEFGCSYQTVADRCHKRGVHIAGPHEICKKKKQLVIDGHTFYWIDKGYYRGSVNGERIMLADYRYRQMFGTQKPKGTVIMFKDGNHDNYAIENLYFISTSEYMKLRNEDPEIHARNIEILNKGREENIERERKRPWLAKKKACTYMDYKTRAQPGQHQRNEGCTDKAKECGRTRILLHTGANRTP